jgi:outer membrane protein TolC
MKKFSFTRLTPKRLGLLLAMLLAGAAGAQAQEPVQLTLQGAIDAAIGNNRDLATARLTIRNSDAQVTEAYSNALPSLTWNAGYQYNIQKQVFYFPGNDGIPRPISIGANNAVSTDLTLTQVIFNNAVLTGVGTARTYAQIARQQLRGKTSDIVFNVKRAYYTALLAKQVLDVNQTLLQNASENLKNTQVLYKAGLRAEFDAIRADVQYANQQPVVVQARNNYEMALDNLKLLLGYDDTKQIVLAESLTRPVAMTGSEPTIDQARQILEQNNPTLHSLKLAADVNQ